MRRNKKFRVLENYECALKLFKLQNFFAEMNIDFMHDRYILM